MGVLELHHEEGGLRNYLDGQPIHAGDKIEWCRDGKWILGRYEWNWRLDDRPSFYMTDNEVYPIEPDACFRWPHS